MVDMGPTRKIMAANIKAAWPGKVYARVDSDAGGSAATRLRPKRQRQRDLSAGVQLNPKRSPTEDGMRVPRILRIFKQSWIYFLGATILGVVLLTWYHLDPSTAPIALH
jgi:hypothetical protein